MLNAEDYFTPDMRHGVRLYAREGTSDKSVIHSTSIHDEYGIADLDLEGWALDVGAHIGSVCIPLAAMNPRLRVLAVEALPENVELMRRNIEANGLTENVIPVHAALSDHDGETVIYGDYRTAKGLEDSYVLANRWIGGIARGPHLPEFEATAYTVRAVTLTTLLADIDEVAWAKFDCESSEWFAFADPAIVKLRTIVGEYHDRTENDLFEALHLTHEVTTMPASPESPDTGGIGMFWAERR